MRRGHISIQYLWKLWSGWRMREYAWSTSLGAQPREYIIELHWSTQMFTLPRKTFSISHHFDLKTCLWSFRREGRNFHSAEPLVWPLINMHKVSLKNKAQISCASFSFIAITRSFQSLRIMKLFDKSVFGILWTKKPRILRNYSLTSITGNQIPELRDKK